MRVKIQQFLNQAHSWSYTGIDLGRAFLAEGHDVDFIPTDEGSYFPEDLKPLLKQQPENPYDIQVSYTQPLNWRDYLNFSGKKFAIWNYEYQHSANASGPLLPGFGKNHVYTDMILPSSEFSKKVFLDMGVPENKLTVVPHGYNEAQFATKNVWPLKTKKSIKILLNIMQPHKRKNIPAALESYGKAFKKGDDVCLVCKVFIKNKKNNSFDVDFNRILQTFKQKYKNHAEIELVTEFIPNMAELYNACDIHFSATHCECFFYPGLEAMVAGLINVVPNYSGHLDFCKPNNSLLIDGNIVRADRDEVYWTYSPYCVKFNISTDDAASKLRYAVENAESLKAQFADQFDMVRANYKWSSVVKKILDI